MALRTQRTLSLQWVPSVTPLKRPSIISMPHGGKVGLIKVRLYRPFSTRASDRRDSRATVKTICRSGSYQGARLHRRASVSWMLSWRSKALAYGAHAGLRRPLWPWAPRIPFLLTMIIAVYKNAGDRAPKKRFTVGINDDVTDLSLEMRRDSRYSRQKALPACKFWGLGSDGTVGANKNSIKIIGDHTDMYVQAYFDYDSKKSGGLTCLPSAFRRSSDQIHLPDQQSKLCCLPQPGLHR